jgi:hypothetical protein
VLQQFVHGLFDLIPPGFTPGVKDA